MAKLSVQQKKGEITFTPGGIGEVRTYKVNAGVIDVDDVDVDEVLRHVDGARLVTKETLADVLATDAQTAKDAEAAAKAAADNDRAVAEGLAAGAARAIAKPK